MESHISSLTWLQGPAPPMLPVELAQGRTFPHRQRTQPSIADLQQHTDDLNDWLAEYPDQLPLYQAAAAWLNYQVAMTLASSRFTELALHYFEHAVTYQPDNTACRVNYAVALHSLEKEIAALEQYELALPQLEPVSDSNIFHLAARLHARHGNTHRAIELLRLAAQAMPEDPTFWDLWASLEPPTALKKTKPAAELPSRHSSSKGKSPSRFCRHCGSPVSEGARFCGQCGQSLLRT